jgi:hypothetical protein
VEVRARVATGDITTNAYKLRFDAVGLEQFGQAPIVQGLPLQVTPWGSDEVTEMIKGIVSGNVS